MQQDEIGGQYEQRMRSGTRDALSRGGRHARPSGTARRVGGQHLYYLWSHLCPYRRPDSYDIRIPLITSLVPLNGLAIPMSSRAAETAVPQRKWGSEVLNAVDLISPLTGGGGMLRERRRRLAGAQHSGPGKLFYSGPLRWY